MHLKPEELVDLAEGTRADASMPHLATCDRCRRQLAELRAMMTTISSEASRAVPEPSPLYWDHFQERVSQVVAAEGRPSRLPWLAWSPASRVLVPIGATAIAALAVVVLFESRITMPPIPSGPVPVASQSQPQDTPDLAAGSRVDLLNDLLADDDPSLALVAGLTEMLDWNAAGDAGLATRGSAEHAVTHLSTPELLELQRLLRQEIAKGA